MSRVTTAERTQMDSGGDSVQRFIAVGTRAVVFSDMVTAIVTDPDTGSIIALDHVNSWAGSGIQPGMTVDIGRTPGAHDVGSVRLRYYNTEYDYTRLTIAETAPAELQVEVGHYLTVRMEYRPWRIPKRIVTTRDGDGNITDVVEYLDYDLEYPSGGNPHTPKANITAGQDDDGNWLMPRLADWEDTPGCGYRTVTLSSLASVAHNPGLSIGGVVWTVDGTYVVGGFTDTEITVKLDVGFQYVVLQVTDGYQLDWIRLPFWTFDDGYQPLTNFTVAGDETEAGREMAFNFTGNANEADVTVLPEGALILYFELPTWGTAGAVPANYRGQCMGWVTDDTPLLKLADSRYSFKMAGAQRWWASYRATSLTIIDPDGTPSRYSEMEHITVNRVLDFALRAYSTVRSLVNIFYTDVATEVEIMTLPLGNTWQQMTQLAPTARMTMPRCDSLGNLYLRRHYSYLADSERRKRPAAIALTPADWKDEDGLELPTNLVNSVGRVNANGELWDNDQRVLYAAVAPGKRDSYGLNSAKLPDQFLDAGLPQFWLTVLAGYHFWHENNPRPSVTLKLLGNLDVVEPAWGEPVSITWTGETVRGTTLNADLFLVNHISTQHGAAPEDEPKTITLTLEQVTGGARGAADDTRQYEGVDQPGDTAPSPLLAGQKTIAAFSTNGNVYITNNFDVANPNWSGYDLTALGMGGTLVMFIVDAFSPLYLGTGTAVNGWIVTTTEVRRITDIFDNSARALGTATTLTQDTPYRSMQFERGTQNLGYIVSYGYDVPGVYVARTTDGETWTETQINAFYDTSAPNAYFPGASLNYQTGALLTSAFTASAAASSLAGVGKTTSSGSSFANTGLVPDTGNGLACDIHQPFQNQGVAYYGKNLSASTDYRLMKTVNGGTPVDVSPTYAGDHYGPNQQFQVKTCDVNYNVLLMIGIASSLTAHYGVFLSTDGGSTWTNLLAPGDTITGGNIAGDSDQVLYLWGLSNDIRYSSDRGTTIVSKQGDIPTLSGGVIVNICGGGA